MNAITPCRIYRKAAVKSMFCIADSTVYLHQKQGLLTKAINLGPRAVGWPANELDAIMAARVAGKSEPDIKALVVSLTAARQTA